MTRIVIGKQTISRAQQLANIRFRRCLRGDAEATSRFVTYLADAGMCNRLRAHLIAAAFARKTKRNLILRWRKNRQCGAAFEDLFVWGTQRYGRFADIAIQAFPGIHTMADDYPLSDDPAQLVLFDVHWQWATPSQFSSFLGPYEDDARQWLEPVPAVSDRVAAAVERWPEKIIGVHVRRGDFQQKEGWAIGTERYLDAMRIARERAGDDSYFFLASDAPDEELRPIFEQFKGSLLRSPPSPRDSSDGVSDALVTMLLLSRTQRLLLTPRSSFGETAAFLGGQHFEYVT